MGFERTIKQLVAPVCDNIFDNWWKSQGKGTDFHYRKDSIEKIIKAALQQTIASELQGNIQEHLDQWALDKGWAKFLPEYLGQSNSPIQIKLTSKRLEEAIRNATLLATRAATTLQKENPSRKIEEYFKQSFIRMFFWEVINTKK
jgi:hypothetical protein